MRARILASNQNLVKKAYVERGFASEQEWPAFIFRRYNLRYVHIY